MKIYRVNKKKVQLYDFTNGVKWMHDYMQCPMVRYVMKRLNTTSNFCIHLYKSF